MDGMSTPLDTMPDPTPAELRDEARDALYDAARDARNAFGELCTAATRFSMAGEAKRADDIERLISDLAEITDAIEAERSV
jgi:hypothetical protein